MPTKIFTILGGGCPFRTGTGTFFWCKHPDGQKRVEIAQKAPEIAQKAPEIAQPKRKRGRPPGKATKKPVKRIKNKK